MAEPQGKTLPHNIQAEQCVLGCLLLDYVGCEGGIDKLTVDDFFLQSHKTIFEAMQGLLNRKDKTIDYVTVVDALKTAKKLESVGGVAYLNALNDAVPSVANFRHYYDIVKKDSVLRKLNSAGRKIVDSSWASDDEQSTLADAEKIIFDISKNEERKELTPIAGELSTVVARLDEIRRDPRVLYGIKTGFYGIDDMTNGLHGGELVILAARPGVGKTALGLNMIINASKAHKKCAIFSLEMSKASLTQRAICSLAMVNSYRAGRGELTEVEWHKLLEAGKVLANTDIYIDDNSDITPMEIKRKCMRLKREKGLDFVMVDYLGLMNAGGGVRKFDNRQVEVASNSRAMKILAKELDIPVLLLAQLNRNVETRNKKDENAMPELHDLRESGAIEQDADIVMFIHMPKRDKEAEQNQSEDTAIEATINIAKHRNGPTGFVRLAWQRAYTAFRNLETSEKAQKEMESDVKKPTLKKQVELELPHQTKKD